MVSGEPNFKQFSLSATKGTPSKLDTQLPFEEREKEEEASTHSLTFLFPTIGQPYISSPPGFAQMRRTASLSHHSIFIDLIFSVPF
jgi:hypothetical protein